MRYYNDFEKLWKVADIKGSAMVVLDYCNYTFVPNNPIPVDAVGAIVEFLAALSTMPPPIDNQRAFESVCRVIYRRLEIGTENRSDSDKLN